jgi:hypothetical protein
MAALSNSARNRMMLPVRATTERKTPETIPIHVWIVFRRGFVERAMAVSECP